MGEKKLELLREQEINKVKYNAKRMLNMLDDETSNISENLDEYLTTLKPRCEFFKSFERERKL